MTYLLAISTMLTAVMPPAPIWDVISKHPSLMECRAAWDVLPSYKQHYAKCLTPEELAEASKPIVIPASPR